jgi:uncharacterized protein
VIVADTGAILALVDADDRHHAALRRAFEQEPEAWVLPWSILPEVDYLLTTHVAPRAAERFLADLAEGAWRVEWGEPSDLRRAHDLCRQHRSLAIGLVDATVMAVAERRRARAIATLDVRHFGAVVLRTKPRLLPRDL